MFPKTNALEYMKAIPSDRLKLPWSFRLYEKIKKISRVFKHQDDFDWESYTIHYRAESAFSRRFFSMDLSAIDFKFSEGKIYILGDCMPLNLTWRCLYEAVCNIPGITSVSEIGVGGGTHIANLRTILSKNVVFSGYDISERQLLFFKEQYPDVYSAITTSVLDLTETCIPQSVQPDVVLASTVLMHIQRPDAYQRSLHNLLLSSRKYVVLMDNWNTHDYFLDLTSNLDKGKLYFYYSGANIAIVISLQGEILDLPYQSLNKSSLLGKYLKDYKY